MGQKFRSLKTSIRSEKKESKVWLMTSVLGLTRKESIDLFIESR